MKPILFNTQMVRAIIEDRKYTTRRLLKPQPVFSNPYEEALATSEICDDGTWCIALDPFAMICEERYKPPYKAGDILYVRESWAVVPDILKETPGPVYKADFTETELEQLKMKHFHWKPSIHMPSNIARIFLCVLKVNLQRLQEITPDQCAMEGIELYSGPIGERSAYYKSMFSVLWNSTVSKNDLSKHGWEANPWVWTIEFVKVQNDNY